MTLIVAMENNLPLFNDDTARKICHFRIICLYALFTPVATDTDSSGRCDFRTDRDDPKNTIYSLRIYLEVL